MFFNKKEKIVQFSIEQRAVEIANKKGIGFTGAELEARNEYEQLKKALVLFMSSGEYIYNTKESQSKLEQRIWDVIQKNGG